MFSLLLFVAVVNLVKGECPSALDIPISIENGTFTCATYWKGPGDASTSAGLDACNSCDYGDNYTMIHGEDMAGEANSHYPMGSIFVKAGCTLYMYYDNDFSGETHEIGTGSAAVNEYENKWGRDGSANCATGPGSYKCRCVQQPVTCVPEDGYDVLIQCDNVVNNFTSTSCSYTRTIGTKYETSLVFDMGIDVTISEEISVQFFRMFSETLGISATTGFNWQFVSNSVQGEQTEVKVDVEAPPGTTATIEQTIGHCGGSDVNTDMFRTSVYSKDGKLVSRKIERLPIDGMATLIDQWQIQSDEMN